MFMFKSSRKVIFVLAVVMMIMVNCFVKWLTDESASISKIPSQKKEIMHSCVIMHEDPTADPHFNWR